MRNNCEISNISLQILVSWHSDVSISTPYVPTSVKCVITDWTHLYTCDLVCVWACVSIIAGWCIWCFWLSFTLRVPDVVATDLVCQNSGKTSTSEPNYTQTTVWCEFSHSTHAHTHLADQPEWKQTVVKACWRMLHKNGSTFEVYFGTKTYGCDGHKSFSLRFLLD